MPMSKNVLSGVWVIACVLLLNACVVVSHHPDHHAPGHTRTPSVSSYHHWYYYPDTRVYYHITQGYYYYPVGGSWKKATKLPPGWVVDRKNRVRLKIVGKPYSKHADHQSKYPARTIAKKHTGGQKLWLWEKGIPFH